MSDQQTPDQKEDRRTQDQRIIRRSTLISLVGGVLFATFGYVLYKSMPSPYRITMPVFTQPTKILIESAGIRGYPLACVLEMGR